MNHSGNATKLKLAYAPLSNHDFTIVKAEKIVQQILEGSMLYAITQRPLLTFENITHEEATETLHFDIFQQGTNLNVNCSLPLYQEHIGQDETKPVEVNFGSYDKNWNQTALPLTDLNGIQFYDHESNFLLWLSPDKFLHHYSNKIISATIIGDYKPLTTFNVHYVGKATDQEIWRRLTGHPTLQDILSLENPFNYGTLPTHEIVLLLFRVADNFSIRILDGTDNIDEFVDTILGKDHPTEKDVSLDAEKVLIKVLDPTYNYKKFPNYPISKDGLYKFNFNRFAYQISENITLAYSDGAINCNINDNLSDLIAIENNETLTIIRHGQNGKDEPSDEK